MPGRAAYMDGRSGASSMRLNFAGVPEEDIREGIRRIGRVVREQVGLFGTLTGSPARAPARRAATPRRRGDAGARSDGRGAGRRASSCRAASRSDRAAPIGAGAATQDR